MPATLTHHHERADVTFTWTKNAGITIRPGDTVPYWGVYPNGISFGELPFTLSALRDACDACEGRETHTDQNFAKQPWTTHEFSGCVQVRYRGGPVLEAAPTEHWQPVPADSNDWQPIIDLAADDRTPPDVTSYWLYRRTSGWSTGVLEHLGIHAPQQVPDPARYGDGTDDSILAWTIRHLPSR